MPPDQFETGVARAVEAARQIFDDPDLDVDYEPTDSIECDAAVRTLGDCFARAGGTVDQMIRNAREAAKLLSDDPLQGLAEIVQNANDVGATEVIFHRRDTELLVVHNGRPVTLRDLHSLAAPWLTSKRDDPRATGRFGIGLSTLHSISDAFDLHCGHYHVRLGDPTIRGVAEADHSSIGAEPGHTVMRVPFSNRVITQEEFFRWGRRWDDASLLFLDSVRRISFLSGGDQHDLTLAWQDEGGYDLPWDDDRVRVTYTTATATDGRAWRVHRVEVPSPTGVARAHKRTSDRTPIAVALAVDESLARGGQLYAGLPVVEVDLPMRMSAQFDPVTSRRSLSDTSWNQALLPMLGRFWRAVIGHTFRTIPATVWANIPAAHVDATGESFVDAFSRMVLEDTVICLTEAEVRTESGRLPLARMAFEAQELEGLVTEAEIRRLCDAEGALPQDARDGSQVWRTVLEGWLERGGPVPSVLTIETAIELLDDEVRSVVSLMALAALAIQRGLDEELAVRQFVTLVDGTRHCPDDGLPIVQSAPGGLADRLGFAEVIAGEHLVQDLHAQTVERWLRDKGYLMDHDNDEEVLVRLAREADRESEPRHLDDEQITELRSALEKLGKERWEAIAPRIGNAITLDCFTHDARGRRVFSRQAPADAYLPRALDSEPNAFSVAAGHAPGLAWVAAKYQRLLASGGGRSGLGAHRFLRVLGVRNFPRIVPHPGLERTYSSSPLRGLRAHASGLPQDRARALRDLGADYTLEDSACPDLVTVLRDIAAERQAKKRRARADAVLGMLARGWRAEIGDLADADAVTAHYGWNHRGTVKSAWLWEAGAIEWLDDAAGRPCRPIDLRVRTDSTIAVHGADSPSFIHKDLSGGRPDVLESLGVEGEATTAELLTRLRELRAADADHAHLAAATTIVYRALSSRVGDRAKLRVSMPELRRQLDDRQGLIYTSRGWAGPANAFRGEPILGQRRGFVTAHPATEPLWKVLSLRVPGVTDCLSVLSEIAKTGDLSGEDQAIALDTLRHMAHLCATTPLAKNQLRRLTTLPLWTGSRWERKRPVYVTPDPLVAVGLGSQIPVWNPGGQVQQFEALFELLRVTTLPADSWRVDRGDHGQHDSELTSRFEDIIEAMKDDLVRNEPQVAASISIGWDELRTFEVWVRSGLRLIADLPAGSAMVDVSARLDSTTSRLYLNHAAVLDRIDAGTAIAGAFSAAPRSIGHAWLAAISRIETGAQVSSIRLAKERARLDTEQTESSMTRLEQLQSTVKERRATTRHSKVQGATNAAKGDSDAGSTRSHPPRQLVDTASLVVTNPDGEIVTSSSKHSKAKQRGKEDKGLPPPRRGGARPTSRTAARLYTDLEKEERGLEIVRMVLASDDQRMVDLRGQHGLGADAVDELEQYFELKVSAGSEPDTVRLEADQVRRAMTTDNFFLVVVSGVEGANASPQVRIIEDLRQLQTSASSKVQFSGVQSSESLVFRLNASDVDGTDSDKKGAEHGP